MGETIIQKNTLSQFKFDMGRYSIESNRRRAFPDDRDGLKISYRRTLYVMACELPCRERLVKTAQITGKVIGEDI